MTDKLWGLSVCNMTKHQSGYECKRSLCDKFQIFAKSSAFAKSKVQSTVKSCCFFAKETSLEFSLYCKLNLCLQWEIRIILLLTALYCHDHTQCNVT